MQEVLEFPLCTSVTSVVESKHGDGVRHNRRADRLITPTKIQTDFVGELR
jgi:hypothetical protein